MKLAGNVTNSLKLTVSASVVLESNIEHFPPLVSDECLSRSANVIANFLKSRLRRNHTPSVEVIGYPRRTFGIRPVAISSIADRTLYHSLIEEVRDTLPESSRGDDNWHAHREFGIEDESPYIVEFDIASCYEYIDHDILGDELVLRTMNPEISSAIGHYLGESQARKMGLPQLSPQSDLLADTYLEILNRSLQRTGVETSRFADDFRVLTDTQSKASRIIESAAEFARKIGLVLAMEKTGIYRWQTVASRHRSEEVILADYFNDVEEAIRQSLVLLEAQYIGEDDAAIDFDPERIEFEAYHAILDDWDKAASTKPSTPQSIKKMEALNPLVGRSLRVLRNDVSKSVRPDLLRAIVYDNPSRLDAVTRYVISRSSSGWDEADNWRTIKLLSAAQQQSAWAKLWLIYAARTIEFDAKDDDPVIEWLSRQLHDRHELVRGESAWLLAQRGLLKDESIIELFRTASDLTKPILAASAVLAASSDQFINALAGDSPLTKEAVKWAREN